MARSKKSLKKIQSLVFLMLITLILGITATYAWFSTQRDVEIAGMRLNVEVAESMQISLDGEKWTQTIQIADMRQFYGTYDASGSEGFAVYQAKDVDEGGNQNYVPTELKPVSTAGEVAGGKLQFVQGTISTNSDGTQSLTGVTLCSETDLTWLAYIEDKEENNEKHPYLVFDMYLRNISAKTTGIDELELNEGSSVFVNSGSSDDADQEGKGVAGTGLEYSARVGMIVYGNTVSVTAEDDATLGTVGEQIRAITADNSEVAAIWEPNFREHTQYVVSNNGRGITSVSQEVTTYGIKSAVAGLTPNSVTNVNADTDANSDGVEDTNANLVAVKTFKPGYTSVDGGTDDKEVITNTAGNSIGLAPNQISKVRVYIWLEGQDPDCIDMASTGDKLNVNLRLTKEANTITDNGYTGEYTGGGSGSGTGGITEIGSADEITVADYGAYVTNYYPPNGISNDTEAEEYVGWRIFHTDGTNIYLIADNYIQARNNEGNSSGYIPAGKRGTENTLYYGENYDNDTGIYTPFATYRIEGFDAASDYEGGIAEISSDLRTKLLSQFTYECTNYAGKSTAYLMDTSVWNTGFANNYADYALGAPTIELFAKSYNIFYNTNMEMQIKSETPGYGYYVILGENHTYYETIPLNDSSNLYALGDRAKVQGGGYVLASPAYVADAYLLCVEDDGGGSLTDNMSTCGMVRPIICLNSSVQLEKQADGSYLIVE